MSIVSKNLFCFDKPVFMSFIKLLSYIIPTYKICGRVAQLVEHYLDMVVVVGSSPIVATIFTKIISLSYLQFQNSTSNCFGITLFPEKAFIQLCNNECTYIHCRRIDKNNCINHARFMYAFSL